MLRTEIHPAETDPRALGTVLAALAPLSALLASAAAYPAAAGGDRALAAALSLAPAEPPGYPLLALVLRACALLPLGPLALRATLGTALLTALAAAALYRALDTALHANARLRPLVASPLALGLTATAFGSHALFAAETSAHAAALALSCACLERLVAFECARPRLELAALRAAALLWSLLLVEQPVFAAVLLLAALTGMRRVLGEYRLPAWNLAPLALGLPLWLYGPLAHTPELGLAHADSPLAVLRAAFAHSAANAAPAAAVAEIAPASLVLAGLAALGGALALRAPAQRRLGLLWVTVGAVAYGLQFVLPDAPAYRALALCAAGALAAFACAPLLAGSERSRLAPWLGVVLVVLGLSQLHARAREALRVDHAAVDALGDTLRRSLPARSALLLAPELAAAFLDAEHEERVRPDLLVALQPWWLDLRAAERVADQSPELVPLLRAQLLARTGTQPARGARAAKADELPLVELAALAARRPLLLELSPALDPRLHAALLPYALYHQVSTHSIAKSDIELAAREGERRIARLYAQLDLPGLDAATLRVLRTRHAAELHYARSVDATAIAERAGARLAELPADPAQ